MSRNTIKVPDRRPTPKPEPDEFSQKIKTIMDNAFPDGYRFAVFSGKTNVLISHSGGFARKAIDPPQIGAFPGDRINIASMSKLITAIGVVSTLQAKNVSIDSLVVDFLPPSWTLHPLVKTLTFQDFLTHRSGFDNDRKEDLEDNNPDNDHISDGYTYEQIKLSLEKGPTFEPKKAYRYVNIDFNIFRIILPYLDSYNPFLKKVTLSIPPTSSPDKYLADSYINIINKRVFEPSFVAKAACDSKTLTPPFNIRPQPKVAVLVYEYNNPSRPGLDLGDATLTCGGSGWNISVLDLNQVLQSLLFTEALVSEKNRLLFTAGEQNSVVGVGMNRDADLVGSKVYSHGGWIPIDKRELHAGYMYFAGTKTILTFIGNGGQKPPSTPSKNWDFLVKDAYVETYGLKNF